MKGTTNAGRPAVIITTDEEAIWNERFARVFYREISIALIHDALTGYKHRAISFQHAWGAKARAWLDSPNCLTYYSELGWLNARIDAPPLSDAAKALRPTAERAK
jgi:hypothetical protein